MGKIKPIISVEHAANWYAGNYLENPNNALREDEKLLEEAFASIENLKKEFAGQKITHRQFLDLVKEKGIHQKFYHYRKPEPNDCPICKAMGIKW
ncbi:MAG: hypothetical protein HY392_04600 [Candidatus Diapherotrites archaeon]|nr:hypothetical protein [Candidatus Diapherotrites archaeon]